MRCRELDIFIGFLRNFLYFLGVILGKFFGIFWEEFFGRIFREEFFGRNFLGEIFWEDLFGRIFLRGILLEEFFVYVGLSRFCLNKEGRRRKKISILRSASASISHLKIIFSCFKLSKKKKRTSQGLGVLYSQKNKQVVLSTF